MDNKISKLKQIIENRKHEKITNERGQFYFLTKLFLCFASELIPSIKHMRGEGTWYRVPIIFICCIYYIAKRLTWQYAFGNKTVKKYTFKQFHLYFRVNFILICYVITFIYIKSNHSFYHFIVKRFCPSTTVYSSLVLPPTTV